MERNRFYAVLMIVVAIVVALILHDLFIPLFMLAGASVLIKDDICEAYYNWRKEH